MKDLLSIKCQFLHLASTCSLSAGKHQEALQLLGQLLHQAQAAQLSTNCGSARGTDLQLVCREAPGGPAAAGPAAAPSAGCQACSRVHGWAEPEAALQLAAPGGRRVAAAGTRLYRSFSGVLLKSWHRSSAHEPQAGYLGSAFQKQKQKQVAAPGSRQVAAACSRLHVGVPLDTFGSPQAITTRMNSSVEPIIAAREQRRRITERA